MDTVKKYLEMTFTNPYSKTILTMFLVLYGGLAAPKLPGKIVKLFDNNIFRVILLSLIVYTGHQDPKFSILIAICFVLSMETLRRFKMKENFEELSNNVENFASSKQKCDDCLQEKFKSLLEKILEQNELPKSWTIKSHLKEFLAKHSKNYSDEEKEKLKEFLKDFQNKPENEKLDKWISSMINRINKLDELSKEETSESPYTWSSTIRLSRSILELHQSIKNHHCTKLC